MFEQLFFKLDFNLFEQELYGTHNLVPNEPKHDRFKQICETHLDQITDVFIQMLSIVFSESSKDDEEVKNLHVGLWFGFLKVQLNFNEKDRAFGQCVQDNINRAMSYLVVQSGICKQNDEIWNKSWVAINSFFP